MFSTERVWKFRARRGLAKIAILGGAVAPMPAGAPHKRRKRAPAPPSMPTLTPAPQPQATPTAA
jgi:hypothetical protein